MPYAGLAEIRPPRSKPATAGCMRPETEAGRRGWRNQENQPGWKNPTVPPALPRPSVNHITKDLVYMICEHFQGQ